MISLSAKETQSRFSLPYAIQITHFPNTLTQTEESHVRTVLQYMSIAYSPSLNKGASSVRHLCCQNPKNTFHAPSTFPTAHTAEEYAESHSHVMASLPDLHIISFQVVNVKENLVSLRYEAEGSHTGEAHGGIEATGRKARWSGAGNFVMDDDEGGSGSGLIGEWWKDWDKMQMWKGLGWVRPDNDRVEFA